MTKQVMSGATPQNLPNLAGPFVDPTTGILTPAAQGFFRTLFQRTGGSQGYDLDSTTALAGAALLRANALSEIAAAGTQAEARSNLGLEPAEGWAAPTGTGSRGAINASWSGTASATYTQSELQAAVTQIETLSAATGQLVQDLASYGALGFGA